MRTEWGINDSLHAYAQEHQRLIHEFIEKLVDPEIDIEELKNALDYLRSL